MGLTFCYVAPSFLNGFCTTISHFNEQEISFPKWYSTFFKLKNSRSNGKKYEKLCNSILHNFDRFFRHNFPHKEKRAKNEKIINFSFPVLNYDPLEYFHQFWWNLLQKCLSHQRKYQCTLCTICSICTISTIFKGLNTASLKTHEKWKKSKFEFFSIKLSPNGLLSPILVQFAQKLYVSP